MKVPLSFAVTVFYLISLLIFTPNLCVKADVYQQFSRSYGNQIHVTSHDANSLWIAPSMIELNPNEVPLGYRFNVTFWANSSLETKGWQLWLTYSKTYINATKAAYTAGAKSEFFQTINTFPISPTFRDENGTHNLVIYGEAWVSGPYRSPGWGSLCRVEFEVISYPPEGQSAEISLDIKWAYDLYEPPRTYLFYSDGTYRPLNIQNGLVNLVPSSPTPPNVDVLSPENRTYAISLIPLVFTLNESASWIGYSLDNSANVTIVGNTTLTTLATGVHSIVIYANDTFGNMGASVKVYFTILLVHDIAITDITMHRIVIPQGYNIPVNITVQNQGDIMETFNVTLIANQTTLTTLSDIVLQNGSSVSVILFWNTSGFGVGSYNLSAYATAVLGEGDVDDNMYVAGMVLVVWPFDVTGDNYCGVDDIVSVAEHFGTYPGDENWNQIYDLNCDDFVGIDDIVLIAGHFGEAQST